MKRFLIWLLFLSLLVSPCLAISNEAFSADGERWETFQEEKRLSVKTEFRLKCIFTPTEITDLCSAQTLPIGELTDLPVPILG